MKYCGACGAELKDGAKFCKSCGTKIQVSEIESDTSKQKNRDKSDGEGESKFNRFYDKFIFVRRLLIFLAGLAVMVFCFWFGIPGVGILLGLAGFAWSPFTFVKRPIVGNLVAILLCCIACGVLASKGMLN